MRFFLLLTLIISTGCRSTDVMQQRVEKMRVGVPALFSVEIDYYKNSENEPPPARPKQTLPLKKKVTPLKRLGSIQGSGELMPMNRK